MASRTWAARFLERFTSSFSPADWPTERDDYRRYLTDWIDALDGLGAGEDEADAARRALKENPPAFRRDCIPAVVATVRALRQRPTDAGPASGSREEAEGRSRDCPECGGGGLTSRRFLTADGDRLSFGLACLCPLGAWFLVRFRASDDRAVRGMLALADYPDLWPEGQWHPTWPTASPRGLVLEAVRTPAGRTIELVRTIGPGEAASVPPRPPRRRAWDTGQVQPNVASLPVSGPQTADDDGPAF